MEQQMVSLQQMKVALSQASGSKFPSKITLASGEEIVRYVRGFADSQSNIVLISETSYSLALKIIEVKDIRVLEFASGNDQGTWRVLHGKWLKKSTKPLTLFAGLLSLLLQLPEAIS